MAERSTVRAAGGVLWRRVDGEVQIAFVHRPKYGDWSLPKGKLEPGEPPLVGALREVHEETGFRAVPGRRLGVSRYRVLDRGRDVDKTVEWWAMQAATGEFAPHAEVDALRWLPLSAAAARTSCGHDAVPLSAFVAAPEPTTTLLLVRHAHAGSRDGWSGPDDLRPLSGSGAQQAEALVPLLAAYAPVRVLAAPLLRCVDTVRPLAERLGLEVESAPAAAEDKNPDDASLLLELLADLVALGQPAVVCSQGGVIPQAVESLAAAAGLPVEAAARKGSFWALSFGPRGLVDADYVPSVDPTT